MAVGEEKTGPGQGTAQPVAQSTVPAQTGNVAPGTAASESVPKFGGNRGGKKRADGLAPGSPEALEADKKRDRERKERERKSAAALVIPPALPSAVASGNSPVPAPAGSNVPGLAPQDSAPPAVPWDPAVLKPFVDELLESSEAGRVEKFRTLAIEAGLSETVAKVMSADARYSRAYKVIVSQTAPRVTAQGLNALGISGQYSDHGMLLTALVSNWVQGRRLEARILKLAEERKAKEKASSSAGTGKGGPPSAQNVS